MRVFLRIKFVNMFFTFKYTEMNLGAFKWTKSLQNFSNGNSEIKQEIELIEIIERNNGNNRNILNRNNYIIMS